MFRIILLSLLLTTVFSGASSQVPHGKWRDHFSFNEGKYVTMGDNKVFCATPTGIIIYNNGEIDKITKVNGLTDVDITAIAFGGANKILAVGYENGNIDLVYTDRVVNIPDIKEKSLLGSKVINHFLFYQDKIYTSTDFGIVVIDPGKKEVKDTYFLGEGGQNLKVNCLATYNNYFWAATFSGVLTALTTDPLLVSFDRWTKQSFFANPDAECVSLSASTETIFAIENQGLSNDIVWRNNGAGWFELDRPYTGVKSIALGFGKVVVTSNAGIATYGVNGTFGPKITNYSFPWAFKPNRATPIDVDRIAIADGDAGLVIGTTSEQYSYTPQGPASNKTFSIGVSSDRVVVASGGYDGTFSNLWNIFRVHRFRNEQWSDFTDWERHDAAVVEFDPRNPSNYFVGSWGHGVYQFNGDEKIAHYTPENSSLQSIFPGSPFCRISGLAFDNQNNLWVSNAQVANPISVRKADGSWVSFPYTSAINAEKISALRYSPFGALWLVLPRGEGLFALNPGNDIDSKDDDLFRKIKTYDREGNIFNVELNAMAFDKDGYLWLGTNQGVLLSYNSEKVFDGGTYFQKIKIPDVVPGLAVYLLETESVTTITVDGGNRKWFGTSKSGAFLFNVDGTNQLQHFTAENSPLPTNNIVDIKVHPTTGEVFFATDKGMVAYR
ncbi:MAG TPA: two-component regulator propeller domain-containing protein, partial [Tenuifilaceae bacterium]|nr:two-component regulator propeller domain-containing protein [Tenuifilaceae bacterium]